MTDAEISQRIAGAGFVYDLGTGRYAAEGDSDEPLDYVTEEIADELAIPVKVNFDAEYLRRQSFLFDLRILGLTFLKVVRRDGVSH